MADTMDRFYNGLQTVPKLISDLALSVAEAQRRLDHDYMQNLAEFIRLAGSLQGTAGATPDQLISLFRAMAPSRYQFTETMVEVRADLQMGSMSEFNVGVNAGVKGAVFAVAVNASYARRSAYDARAAALIRTVLNAIPAEPGMLDKLLPRAGEVLHATEPKSERYKELAEAFKEVVSLAPPPLPQEPAKPGETKKTEEAKTTEEKPGETAAPAGETAQTTGETVGETPKADEPAPPDEQADKGAAPVEKSPSATEP